MIILKNKTWKIFCVLLGICVFMTSGCNFGSFRQEETVSVDTPAPEQEEDRETQEIVVSNQTEKTDEPESEEELKEETEEQEEPKKSEETEEPKKPTPQKPVKPVKPIQTKPAATQTKPFWQSETAMHTENLTAVAAAAQQDYKANGARRCWISKNGKLYAYYDGFYITPATLIKDGYLQSGLDTTGYEILLIEGNDLAQYDGASVPADSRDFGTFAAVKLNGKYLIASPSGKAGQISQENYIDLLAKYSQNHGTVGRLSSASAEYDRILNYIGLYEGRFEDVFVREIRKDNKHAVVVLSPVSNTAAIRQYVLKNDNGFWEVVYPNVQMDTNPVYAINRLVPDFNTELLPKYNLATWKSYMKAEQGGAMAALFANHFISSKSEIWYQCATVNTAYFRLRDGSRYVAYLAGEQWTAKAVSSDIEAKNYFLEKTGVDYSFIILDD